METDRMMGLEPGVENMVHLSQVLTIMRADGADGERKLFTLDYIKRNGERTRFENAKFLSFDHRTQIVQLRVPGGMRTVRLWAIVGFEGYETFM